MVRNVSKNIFLQIIFGEMGRRGLRMQPMWTRPRRVDSWHNTCVCVCVCVCVFKFIFNWRIIALQYYVGFCHTTTWISLKYTHVPTLPNLPPYPTSLGCHRAPFWAPCVIYQPPIIIYFTYSSVYISVLLCPFFPRYPSSAIATVCVLCLHLYSWPANRFIGTIFLASIYMH